MNVSEKKLYIYNNIHNIYNHNFIIKLLDDKDIKYTKNTNGFFLNLNILNDELVSNIYDITKINIQNANDQYNGSIEQINTSNKPNIDIKLDEEEEEDIKKKIDTEKYSLKRFNKNQKNIILLSKKYKI